MHRVHPQPSLAERVGLAVEFIQNNLDRTQGFRPYFSYQLVDETPFMLHTFFDTPHVTGRFLDALLRAESMIGHRADEDVERGLTEQLFGSLGEEGLGWAEPGRTGPREAIMHDQRELLLALTGLIRERGSERALAAARTLCRTLWRLSAATGNFPGPALRADGWAPASAWESFRYAPTGSGRLVTALVHFYHETQDPVALQLARRFMDHNLARCFHANGTLSPWSGFHVHSITGTVESMVEFGLLVNEQRYITQAKQIFDVGLRPLMSSYGWVKENLANDAEDGEANNTGEVVRTASLLGQAGYPEYYEIAEKMFHNHLLASQLLDVAWIQARETRERPDEADRTYTNIGARARGGFGFTSPNDWMFDLQRRAKLYPLNADLVQGAVQTMIAFWQHAVTEEAVGTKINCFLDRETGRVKVTSQWPQVGAVDIHMKRDSTLFVQNPSWIEEGSLSIRVNGAEQPAQVDGRYLFLPHLSKEDDVAIGFRPRRRRQEEHINHKVYGIDWLGDRVVRIEPQGSVLPLYVG